jgi:hypothetical protein
MTLEICSKEMDVGIFGSIMGKHEADHSYRTVDGGHPAPYPDMTDEQLYNFELTFEVQPKTFDRPPSPAQEPERTLRRPKEEPFILREPPRREAAPADNASTTSRNPPRTTLPAVPPRLPAPPLDLSRPVRLITTGQPVEIITTRARHPVYKVHGYIGDDDVVTVFTIDGRLSENGLPYLENVPQMDQLYLNIYLNRDGVSTDKYVVTQHPTQQAADTEAAANTAKGRGERLTCVPVQLNA